jgi:hypothetical protein
MILEYPLRYRNTKLRAVVGVSRRAIVCCLIRWQGTPTTYGLVIVGVPFQHRNLSAYILTGNTNNGKGTPTTKG